eukprot:8012046-Alexandrium_andersonii.AAC.1
MRSDLSVWYGLRQRTKRDNLTRVHDLTVKMFGSPTDPKCNLSGAESWGFFLFAIECLQRHRARLPAEAELLEECGLRLARLHDVPAQNSMTLPPAAMQDWRRRTRLVLAVHTSKCPPRSVAGSRVSETSVCAGTRSRGLTFQPRCCQRTRGITNTSSCAARPPSQDMMNGLVRACTIF